MMSDLSFASLVRRLIDTVTNPKAVAEDLLSRDYPREVLWMTLGLVTIISVLMVALINLLMPVPAELEDEIIQIMPVTYGLILGGSLVIVVFAFHYVGLALGGQGHFAQSILTVVWIQVLLIALQLVQVVLTLVSPVIGGLAALISFAISLFVLTHFIQVQHRFSGPGRAVLTIVLAFLGIGIGLALILSLIGVGAGTTAGAF